MDLDLGDYGVNFNTATYKLCDCLTASYSEPVSSSVKSGRFSQLSRAVATIVVIAIHIFLLTSDFAEFKLFQINGTLAADFVILRSLLH